MRWWVFQHLLSWKFVRAIPNGFCNICNSFSSPFNVCDHIVHYIYFNLVFVFVVSNPIVTFTTIKVHTFTAGVRVRSFSVQWLNNQLRYFKLGRWGLFLLKLCPTILLMLNCPRYWSSAFKSPTLFINFFAFYSKNNHQEHTGKMLHYIFQFNISQVKCVFWSQTQQQFDTLF